jgi:Acetyltransferases, including N-acetylases of ribosomal proteins
MATDSHCNALLSHGDIILRALEPSDIDFMYRWENDTDLWKVSCTSTPFSRHLLLEYLQNYTGDIYAYKEIHLMVEDKQSGETVGCVDLFNFDPQNRRVELGMLIVPNQQGKGYGASAIIATKRYVAEILDLHQIYINIPAFNEKNISVYQKNGFTIAHTIKDWVRRDGRYYDSVLLQCLL